MSTAEWRRANYESIKARGYAWRSKNLARNLLINMRGRKKNECTITLAELEELLAPMTCSVTGLPLVFDGPDRMNPWAPSPDRIDPTKGYIPGNVRIVCWLYNRAKGLNQDEDVLTMAKALIGRT